MTRTQEVITLDGVILFMWRQGKDTLDIARRLGLHESVIANRLWKLRAA